MSRTGTFRYVRWQDIDTMHRAGWMVVADLGVPHGAYSCLMWQCDCPQHTCTTETHIVDTKAGNTKNAGEASCVEHQQVGSAPEFLD